MNDTKKIIEVLNHDGVIFYLTDTIYGLLAKANSKVVVEKVFKVKNRNPKKSCIILISDPSMCYGTYPNISFNEPTSLLIKSKSAPKHLLRYDDYLAYRVPFKRKQLLEIINAVGPLIAPSANPEGLPPAKNISEAKAYFGNQVDLYVDCGKVKDNTPSRIAKLDSTGNFTYLR